MIFVLRIEIQTQKKKQTSQQQPSDELFYRMNVIFNDSKIEKYKALRGAKIIFLTSVVLSNLGLNGTI